MNRSRLVARATAHPRRLVSAVTGAAVGIASAGLRTAARLVEMGARSTVVSSGGTGQGLHTGSDER